MVSLERCKEILNKHEAKYSHEQVAMIRAYLSSFADIILQSNIEQYEAFRG
jgi:hypothetical protein